MKTMRLWKDKESPKNVRFNTMPDRLEPSKVAREIEIQTKNFKCRLFCGKTIEVGVSIPTRDEPVPMADIIDSFPAVLRVIESMAEENERIKSQKLEMESLLETQNSVVTPQFVEGLATEFEFENSASLIQKVSYEISNSLSRIVLKKGIQFIRQLSEPVDEIDNDMPIEMKPLLLQKADFDQGTEELPAERDPTPPPFHIPRRSDDFEEDECLLRDVSNNQTKNSEGAENEPQVKKKPANRRKRKKGGNKACPTAPTTTTKSWTLNIHFFLYFFHLPNLCSFKPFHPSRTNIRQNRFL